MIKSIALAGTLVALSALTLVSPADATTSTYAVQVKQRPAKIHGDGSITAVFWLRCNVGYNAFEYNVGVQQGDVAAGAGAGGANVLPCDGTRHRGAVNIAPGDGSWSRGKAIIDVNVQIFPGGDGGDLEATDSATVWLKR